MYDFRRSSHKFPTIYWNLIFPISSSLSYTRRQREPKIYGFKHLMERGIRKMLNANLRTRKNIIEAFVISKRLLSLLKVALGWPKDPNFIVRTA